MKRLLAFLRRDQGRPTMHRHNMALKDDIVENGWLIVVTTTGLVFVLMRIAVMDGVRLLLLVALAVFGTAFLNMVIQHQASVLMRRHIGRWAAVTVRYRPLRVDTPAERLPPVATTTCVACLATDGARHTRGCPTIPAAWFNPPTRLTRKR